jgi:negative regulator of flagellin synthesis FlgM
MDISRPSTTGSRPVTDTTDPIKSERAAAAKPAASVQAQTVRPDALHAALQALPDVDMDKVAAMRQALAEGSLDTSPQNLAADMLAFHRGSRR